MIKKYLTVVIFSLFSIHAVSQHYNLEWATMLNSNEFSSIDHIKIDHQGDLISSGPYKGTLSYDALSGDTTSTSNGTYDFFIQKMTPDGELLWINTFGSIAYESLNSMDVDQYGNIYISGRFDGVMDFDPGVGVYNLDGNGNDHFFVAKYDNNGGFIWAKQMITSQWAPGHFDSKITVDQDENVYMVGNFRHAVDFDPGSDTLILDSGPNDDIYILKLNILGEFEWVKHLNSHTYNAYYFPIFGTAITQDNDLLIAGTFIDTLDFDPGPSVHNLYGSPAGSSYILKLSASGDFIWVKQIGEEGQSIHAYDLILDQDDNIVISGLYRDTVNLDTGSGTFELYSEGFMSTYVLKLNASGEYIWVKDVQMGGSSFAASHQLTSDQFRNIYVTCTFDSLQVDSILFQLSDSNDYQNVFTMKLDASGDLKWGVSYGGSSFDICKDIAVNDLGEVYTSGYFHLTADFDPDTSVYELSVVTGVGASANGFIQKLNQCFTVTTDSYSVCDSIVWMDGKTYTEDGQFASFTYLTEDLCDSIIVLDLTVTEQTPTISVFGPTSLITEQDWDSYQWLDCDNNFQEIPQANTFLFTPPAPGNYAVQIESDGCVFVSECFTLEPLSNPEDVFSQMDIYPNPTNGVITIHKGMLEDVRLNVYDVLGKQVYKTSQLTDVNTQIELPENAGIYTVELSFNGIKRQYKVIKY